MIEREVCPLKDMDGCLDKLTPTKKSKIFSSRLVGLLCGSFCKALRITFFKLGEIEGF